MSGAKFTSEINQTISEVVETTWEIVGTTSTADEIVQFPRARIHYNKFVFCLHCLHRKYFLGIEEALGVKAIL